MRHVEQVGAGGLGEHRWRLAGHAEVDGADVEPFQQLRAAGEFGPAYLEALIGQACLQRAAGLEQHQRAVLLIADPQNIVLLRLSLYLGNGAEGNGRGKQGDQSSTQGVGAHGTLLCSLDLE